MVVVTAWWLIGLAISARNGLGFRFAVGNANVVVVAWACDLGVVVDSVCDLGVVVAWACRSCGSRPGFADLGLGLPSLFLLSSGVRYIITSFSFPLFSSKSCEFGFVCDVSMRGLVVYGGLVGVELWMILNGISLVSG